MKELKQVNRIHNPLYDINIDRYITPAIIQTIGDEMLKYHTYTERQFVKNVYLCKWATDIGDKFDYNKNYDLMMSNGVFDTIRNTIVNIDELDAYVDYAECVKRQVGDFLGEAIKILDKYVKKLPKNFDVDKALSYLQEKK